MVPRERLFSLLDENRGRPLIWITAPPGSGKTALIASYLEAREFPFIWYQIDSGDADPGSFFLHLSQATQDLLGQENLNLPRFAPEHHVDVPGFSRLYFRALFAHLPESILLVLDNYQEVNDTELFHEIVRQAVSDMPTHSSAVVLSRAEAPKQFVHLSATGAQASIGWNELQMTLDEVRAICAQRRIKDEWLLQALHHQSQGWAAGITLMIERLGNVEGQSRTLPDETRESVFNYFASLIFDHADPVTREILLSVAYLRNVTPSIARTLSGSTEAPVVLEDLYRRRMFTDRRSGVEPVYQFHALFREFLRSRAATNYSKEKLRELKYRSASTLEDIGELDQAMALWFSIADWDRAITLIAREAKSVLDSGRRQTVLQWIEQLPDEQSNAAPWMLYWHGIAQYQSQPEVGLESLQKALELFRHRDDRRGRMICLASLLSYGMVGYSVMHVLEPWLEELLLLSEERTGDLTVDDELRVAGVLSHALYYCKSSHPMTRVMAARAEDLLALSGDATAKLEAAMGAITACGQGGDFDRGERILRATQPCAEDPSASPSMAAWWYVQAGYLRFNRACYDDALAFFRAGCHIAEKNGLRESMRELIMFCVMVEFRLFGWTVAGETLAQVEAMPPSPRPMAEALLKIYQARKAQSYGMLDRGADLARESHQAVMRANSRFVEMGFGLFNAESMIVAGRLGEALPLLARSRQLFEQAAVFDFFAALPDLVEALAALMSGKRENAIALTRKSLALARIGNRRFAYRYLECSMPPLFRLALEEKIEVDFGEGLDSTLPSEATRRRPRRLALAGEDTDPGEIRSARER